MTDCIPCSALWGTQTKELDGNQQPLSKNGLGQLAFLLPARIYIKKNMPLESLSYGNNRVQDITVSLSLGNSQAGFNEKTINFVCRQDQTVQQPKKIKVLSS